MQKPTYLVVDLDEVRFVCYDRKGYSFILQATVVAFIAMRGEQCTCQHTIKCIKRNTAGRCQRTHTSNVILKLT